jgi:hypothetical protein
MPVFSICSTFIANAGNEPFFLLNVLYRFAQENPLRIAIDRPAARAISLYEKACIGRQGQEVRRWLKFLGRNPSKHFEFIDADVMNLDERRLFVEIASLTIHQRCVICWSLQDYASVETSQHGVELIDRDEAVHRVHAHDAKRYAPETKSAKGTTMTNVFVGNSGTIIVDSLLSNSLNRIKEQNDEAAAAALKSIAELVSKANRPDANALLNTFNEEIVKPAPNKDLLRGLWNGLVTTLPEVAKLGDAAAKISVLFN